MVAIVQKENVILRKTAVGVPPKDIRSRKIKAVITAMKEALAKEADGVALAAPQIGKSLRIFIVSGNILRKEKDGPAPPDLIFINPALRKLSRKKVLMEEGCLSVRPLYGRVPRSLRATVEALDEEGRPFTRGASGLLAQIFQHEIDHLDGVLFTDKAAEVFEIPPHVRKKAAPGA